MTNEKAREVLGDVRAYLASRSSLENEMLAGYTFTDICNAIKALEQTRWIPCSERLPMAFEFVNCTCHSLIDDREDWVIETIYVPQPSNSTYSDWGNIPMLNSGDCKVVAWIHRDIPEPYKAESEDEE